MDQQQQPAPPMSELNNPIVEDATADSHDQSEKKSNEIPPSKGGNTDAEYPPMREVIPIILALALAMFLNTLDRSIVATAIPRITDEFNSLGDVGWYGSAYMLTSSALMLLFGKFYTFYSPKYVLLIAIGLFEIGSAICGAAPSSLAFIIGRAVAGWGASGIFTGAVVTIQHILPLQKRPMIMGIMGAVFGISSVAGPLIGGAFTDKVSWRWCFFINLPIGGVAMTVLLLLLKLESPTKSGTTLKQQFIQLDPLGTICFLPGVICLLLALQWGGSQYPWNDARIIALLVLAGVLIISFIVVQICLPNTATIPPRIFWQRSIASGFSYCLCSGAALFIMIYYIPQWFQAVKGESAVQSGIDTLPFLIALTIATISAGITVSKLGYYAPLMIVAPIIMSIGAGLITTFTVDTTTGKWIGYQIIFGFGGGLGMQQASVAAQTVLNKRDVAIGAALMMLGQQLSGSIFVSVAQSVFINRLVSNLAHVAGLGSVDVSTIGVTDLAAIIPPQLLDTVLVAYNDALRGPFTVGVALASFAIIPALFMEWKSVKGKKEKTDDAA